MSAVVDAPPELPPDEDPVLFFTGVSWTPQIDAATKLLMVWISCDNCGAALWGMPRTGKTEFAKYFERVVDELFNSTVVVIRLWFAGEQITKREDLLKRALTSLGNRNTATRDVGTLRTRLMDEIWTKCTPKTRRIVVIADELQNVATSLYGEFTLIESSIKEQQYIPFLLCIGQPELQSTVANVANNLHIMGRQFQELCEFRGLSFKQIGEFLSSMEGPVRAFSKKHFPHRAARGWSVVELVEPIREAVNSVADLDELNQELYFPMAYLRQTLNYLFFFLSAEENRVKEVTKEIVQDAFDRNGFKSLILSYSKPKLPPEQESGAEASP